MKKDVKEILEIIGISIISYVLVMQLNSLMAKGHPTDVTPTKQERPDSLKKSSVPDTIRPWTLSKLQKTR